MADVIFNGTETRKPVGFGEVSLTLTNCGSDLGVDWHDVRVTRRVYRDGNSEYFLNKTPCRLRDIQSLFADTGVGRSAYSIMEQGKIDLILSSRPEDRRTVFEEAAGITKYKTQKREALRKLEATEANPPTRRHHQGSKAPDRLAPAAGRESAAISGVAGRSPGARYPSFAPAAK
jgi:chromosome segregation protein